MYNAADCKWDEESNSGLTLRENQERDDSLPSQIVKLLEMTIRRAKEGQSTRFAPIQRTAL